MYQSERLSAYAERLIHGFSGKPNTVGGQGYENDFLKAQRAELCAAAGLDAGRLTLPHQIHGRDFRLNNPPLPAGGENCKADAVLVTEVGVPAMIQVADCVPVLIYAPDLHAGAAIHAGWRGTAQGITAAVAWTLIESHGANPETLVAAIGPCIGGCCYEVSDEVADAVGQSIPQVEATQWQTRNAAGKPVIDLKAVNRLQLVALGVTEIDVLPECTRCNPEALWSYRRGENGRQAGYLQLR